MEQFIEMIRTDDEFAKEWGELGPVYGKQWRSWGEGFKRVPNEKGDKVYHVTTTGIDQIANLINDLKTNPDSRRLMVNAWNVGGLNQMVLPPCHYGFQVYTRKLTMKERFEAAGGREPGTEIPTRAISLMWNQRSVDTFLGLPFNIASYGLLLEIIAKAVNMVPDELIGNLGDTHLYLNHIEQAKEQIGREPFELPTLNMVKTDAFWNGFDVSLFGHLDPTDFIIENYQSHPTIKAPLSN
jgi:thymidylate synthase